MAAYLDLDLQPDDALVQSARTGDRRAFDELYRRHATASWGLALAVTRDPLAAETAVAGGFAHTLARAGHTEPGASTPRAGVALLRATRRAAIDATPAQVADGSGGTVLDLKATSPRVATIRAAFDALPERWRSVLWLVDVQGGDVEDVAQVVDVTPGSAGALLERARLGFQEQVLLTGLRRSSPHDCRRTTDRLTAYASGALGERDAARIRTHLDGCAGCRGRLAALDDLVPVLRGTLLALPLLLADGAATRWARSLTRNLGPLRLGMPGGEPMPPWAQRTFAGAVAAFVALGIAGATLVAGRGQGSGRDVVARPANGESALGEPAPTDLDGDPLSSLPTSPPGVTRATPAAEIGGAVALPRTDGSLGVVPDVAGPPDPTAPPPVAPDDAGQVLTVDIPGVVGITFGDDCTGAQVLGTAVGCPPPAGDGPLTLITPLTPAPSAASASTESSRLASLISKPLSLLGL
ncbi:MAG: zf-HC2 domain-containing protein [Acidimicrobiales bacterium]